MFESLGNGEPDCTVPSSSLLRRYSKHLSKPWQVSHWLCKIGASLVISMIYIQHQDYYVFEPAKLIDGSVVIPEHWYTRKTDTVEDSRQEYWARAWMYQVVPSSAFLLSFPHLVETFAGDRLPDPHLIIGTIKEQELGVCLWCLMDPAQGNHWRLQSQGHHILTFMIWWYCDDTSGNLSKKWNKYNSFLFIAAGLSHVMAQKESNVHFLSTSNIAPLLKMLDGIVL
ncbi:hypothetical protein F5I97DRAFT_1827011 [Phlebopus sp. FC_14]|nr:hypothetical protein F5I97DRAFT_1827011 [Phlebopus sp. FC_14]